MGGAESCCLLRKETFDVDEEANFVSDADRQRSLKDQLQSPQQSGRLSARRAGESDATAAPASAVTVVQQQILTNTPSEIREERWLQQGSLQKMFSPAVARRGAESHAGKVVASPAASVRQGKVSDQDDKTPEPSLEEWQRTVAELKQVDQIIEEKREELRLFEVRRNLIAEREALLRQGLAAAGQEVEADGDDGGPKRAVHGRKATVFVKKGKAVGDLAKEDVSFLTRAHVEDNAAHQLPSLLTRSQLEASERTVEQGDPCQVARHAVKLHMDKAANQRRCFAAQAKAASEDQGSEREVAASAALVAVGQWIAKAAEATSKEGQRKVVAARARVAVARFVEKVPVKLSEEATLLPILLGWKQHVKWQQREALMTKKSQAKEAEALKRQKEGIVAEVRKTIEGMVKDHKTLQANLVKTTLLEEYYWTILNISSAEVNVEDDSQVLYGTFNISEQLEAKARQLIFQDEPEEDELLLKEDELLLKEDELLLKEDEQLKVVTEDEQLAKERLELKTALWQQLFKVHLLQRQSHQKTP